MPVWYDLLRASDRVAERTLLGYKSYINNYLEPFFGKKTFDELDSAEFSRFISWAKGRRYRKKKLKNETVNKIFVVLKMICKSAASDHRWGSSYNPFRDFKKLPEGEAYEKIHPFSVEEQGKIIDQMTDHWKPYFRFAFCSGLRQGEQFGLKPDDIDWEKGLLHIRRAITLDENGKIIEGRAKNKYSRRTIKLTSVMYDALRDQKKVFDRYRGEYFFCNMNGDLIRQSNLLCDVWLPALKEAKIKYREMKQTRHSFATIALSCGENPLWIAKVMGHKNTDMIIRVYMKYIENENGSGSEDGKLLDSVLSGTKK